MYNKKYEEFLNDPLIDESDKIILRNFTDEEIKDNFSKNIEFGTAGIRGVRGLGSSKINKYLIRKITQAYCVFLLNSDMYGKEKGVAIAYDSRHLSKEFAIEAGRVFSGNDIKCFIYECCKSTPELSFAIRELGCIGGLVLTASHNPKEYSGYKAYNSKGCQLSTVETNELCVHIDKINFLSEVEYDQEEKTITWINKEIEDKYIKRIKKVSLNEFNKDLKVMYTPLYGVGLVPVERLFSSVGSDFSVVKEQSQPNGDFPTAPKPNPEEDDALKLLIEEGEKQSSELLLATDPDADRLGVIAKDGNKYTRISGNEIGGIFIDYFLKYRKYDNYKKLRVLTSVVSSNFGKTIAESYGVKTEFTLTGFKNLGRKIDELLENGIKTVFTYEESIGFLVDDYIRDKDGISASYILAEIAGVLKREGSTLVDYLKSLYEKHGYFKDSQTSFVRDGKNGNEKIDKIMKSFRNSIDIKRYFDENIQIIDYSKIMVDGEFTDLLYYKFDDGSWVGIRPSGTEPKLKLYVNVKGRSSVEASEKLDKYKSVFCKLIDCND